MENRPIQKLTDDVIGQIAAGEVVERPAAAVKELVENSIDAGATAVTVELTDGGLTSIRVSDNGRGIPAAQMRMAFERHATSKLTNAEELYDIHTLGFRGEALASIAAVGKVTCVSRTANAEFGVKAQVDAGTFVSVEEAASPIGTSVTVKELFYNTPVRLKFLKKPGTEAAYVSDFMMRLILSRPDVAFRFVNQGKTVYRSAGDGTLESAVYCVYGREALQAMRKVQGTEAGMVMEGYVGVGELSRGNRQQQSFFVNGRYFRDDALSKALDAACEGYVMIGRYPICVLSLQIPYRLVDVNVHPNKLEVRFQNHETVADAIEHLTRDALRTVTIQNALAGNQPKEMPEPADTVQILDIATQPTTHQTAETEPRESKPSQTTPTLREPVAIARDASETLFIPPEKKWATEQPEEAETEPLAKYAEPVIVSKNPEANPATMEAIILKQPAAGAAKAGEQLTPEPVQEQSQQFFLPQKEAEPLRYIGAAFKTYLLFEAGERLLMVDQHAAHERVLFDRFMARYQGPRVSQRLLAPQMVRLTARDVATLADLQDELQETGFDLEAFDENTIAVRAIPVILGQNEPVRELLMDLLDETLNHKNKSTYDRFRRRVAQLACKHAIKGGDTLSQEDVKALLEQMLQTNVQPTCPHGRPIVSEITRRELEKRFKRIQ